MPALTIPRLRKLFTLDRVGWLLVWKDSPRNSVPAGSVAGWVTTEGYRIIGIDGMEYMAHILIYAYVHGKFAPHEIDHKNHIKDDNRPSNLISATHAENGKNMSMRADNTSGMMGVNLNKANGRWRARINVNGRQIHLGYFANKKEAIKVKRAAEKEYDFHPNHGRRDPKRRK